jgi:hypothetical protein
MSTLTWDQTWTSEPMVAAADRVAAWAAATLREAGMHGDGLYVATPDSGAREAVAFWAAAHVTGLAFAAPAAFPWTLVNSAAGRISLELGITGPCSTLVGDDDAVDEASWLAATDLADGLVQRAIVVRLAAVGDPVVSPVDEPTRFELSARVLGPADVRTARAR